MQRDFEAFLKAEPARIAADIGDLLRRE